MRLSTGNGLDAVLNVRQEAGIGDDLALLRAMFSAGAGINRRATEKISIAPFETDGPTRYTVIATWRDCVGCALVLEALRGVSIIPELSASV
jgi:hypothetical protein